MESKVPETKIVFDDWCQNTTCHGITDWYHSEKRRARIFWSILSIVFILALIIQTMSLFISFLSTPHYTTNVNVVDNVSMIFPNVTVCNLNRVNRTKARKLGMTSDVISQLFLTLLTTADVPSVFPTEKDQIPLAYGKHMKNWLEFVNKPNLPIKDDPYEMFRYLGHNCEETFQYCLLGTAPFNCCEQAIPVINGEYGLCWSITPPIMSGKQYPEQMLSGATYGLKVKINPALNQYSTDVLYNNYLEEGVVIAVNFNPYRYFYLSPTVVPPGTHVRIGIGVSTQYTKLPPHLYRLFEPPCTETGSLMHFKGPYDRIGCIMDCFQNATMSICNCTLTSETITNKSCTPEQMLNCFFPNIMSILKFMMPHTDMCKEPCGHRMKVKTRVTMNPYPAAKSVPSLATLWNTSTETVRSLVQADIFYPESSYLIAETVEKISPSNFVANIGGAMGLWLGASLVTVIQAFYYMFHFVSTIITRKM